MSLFRDKYRIESARCPVWDYSSPGYYYFTVVARNKRMIFGQVVESLVMLNDNGKIVHDCWRDLPKHYEHVVLDEFIVMPNHIHGVIRIVDQTDESSISFVETGLRPVSAPNETNPIGISTDLLSSIDEDKPIKHDDSHDRITETGLRPVSTMGKTQTNTGSGPKPGVASHGLSQVIASLKSFASRRIHAFQKETDTARPVWIPDQKIWQPRFHDHIIRNADQLEHIRRYIRTNPLRWKTDKHFPKPGPNADGLS